MMLNESDTKMLNTHKTKKESIRYTPMTKECYRRRVDSSNGNQIRARLLNRLGIVQLSSTCSKLPATAKNSEQKIALCHPFLNHNSNVVASRCLDESQESTEASILCIDGDAIPLPLHTIVISEVPCSGGKVEIKPIRSALKCAQRVHFADIVVTIEVPNRDSFTEDEKSFMWTSAQAILDMARKNEKEFFYEKYDWMNVVEEENFVDIGNNLRVHPANVPVGYLARRKKEEQLRENMTNRYDNVNKDRCHYPLVQVSDV